MFNGKTHYKWPFAIAMLVYQRVFHTEADFVLNYDMSDSENGARCLESCNVPWSKVGLQWDSFGL